MEYLLMKITLNTPIKELEKIYGYRAIYIAMYINQNMKDEKDYLFKELMDQFYYETNFNNLKMELLINGKPVMEI